MEKKPSGFFISDDGKEHSKASGSSLKICALSPFSTQIRLVTKAFKGFLPTFSPNWHFYRKRLESQLSLLFLCPPLPIVVFRDFFLNQFSKVLFWEVLFVKTENSKNFWKKPQKHTQQTPNSSPVTLFSSVFSCPLTVNNGEENTQCAGKISRKITFWKCLSCIQPSLSC